eukprot:11828381-Ditylum_brightwellii.AAC.1
MKATDDEVKNEDDGWEYMTFQDDIEAHPANLMDKMYGVTRFMCFNQGSGELEECGANGEVLFDGVDKG